MLLQEFKIKFLEELKEVIKREKKDYVVDIEKRLKVNKTLEAVYIHHSNIKNTDFIPIFYLEDIYQEFCNSHISLTDFTYSWFVKFEYWLNFYSNQEIPSFNKDIVIENIFPIILNKETNKELLDKIVHQDFLDLVVAFRVMMDNNFEDRLSRTALLENAHYSELGLAGLDLLSIAKKNFNGMFKYSFKPVLNFPIDNLPIVEISTNYGCYSANILLEPTFLKKYADLIDSDFYLMPITIDMVLTVPKNIVPNTNLLKGITKSLCRAIKQLQLEQQVGEIISSDIYIYDRVENLVKKA